MTIESVLEKDSCTFKDISFHGWLSPGSMNFHDPCEVQQNQSNEEKNLDTSNENAFLQLRKRQTISLSRIFITYLGPHTISLNFKPFSWLLQVLNNHMKLNPACIQCVIHNTTQKYFPLINCVASSPTPTYQTAIPGSRFLLRYCNHKLACNNCMYTWTIRLQSHSSNALKS